MRRKLAFFGIVLIAFSFMISAELDLEEANVMDVEKNNNQFSVTLYHDDEGEEGYANWWQLETLEGDRIVRRELLHSHGTQNFTRSDTADLPNNISEVVVKGHDQTHGYGGRAIIYDLDTGEKEIVVQGTEPKNFSNTSVEDNQSSNSSDHSDSHNHDHNHSHEEETQKGFIQGILDSVFSIF